MVATGLISLLSPISLLYYVCFGLLVGMTVLVLLRAPHVRQSRSFSLLALSLLGWALTLFLFDRTAASTPWLLWLGRLNFAAAALVAFWAYRLVLDIAALPVPRGRFWLVETNLLAVVSAVTPLIDRAEQVSGGRHLTAYGMLFPLYILHVFLFLAAAVWAAFAARRHHGQRLAAGVRDQLLLVGTGLLASGAIGLIANVLLPYGFGDFKYIDVGPLSDIPPEIWSRRRVGLLSESEDEDQHESRRVFG